jgi:SAM-dependent methyltransferase
VTVSAYRERVRSAILDQEGFVQAVFSGGKGVPWKRVLVRPVLLQGRRHLQVSHFDEKKDITKNYAGPAAAAKVDELLALPFRNIHVQSQDAGLQVQITKKGKAIIGRHKGGAATWLTHDRPKEQPLPAGRPDPFLQAIGIMTAEGKVRAQMRRKFGQINEFLRLILESGGLDQVKDEPLRMVDCGCGSAHLTFAAYHYLNHVLGRPARMVGVDVNQELLARQAALAERLGWDGLSFEGSRILDYQPAERPSMVLALHACDTATDEALAQAVRWGSPLIYAAPCCHHHLQAQMAGEGLPAAFRPVLRHGILKERLGDLLTDGLRAALLQAAGYRADVVEFVGTEHTARNLIIRAVKAEGVQTRAAWEEYRALTEYWGVRSYLEELLPRDVLPE